MQSSEKKKKKIWIFYIESDCKYLCNLSWKCLNMKARGWDLKSPLCISNLAQISIAVESLLVIVIIGTLIFINRKTVSFMIDNIKGPPHPQEKFVMQVRLFYFFKIWNLSMHLTSKWWKKCSNLGKNQLFKNVLVFLKPKAPAIFDFGTCGLGD